MSTGYTTSSGRVSRPPKLFGADQTVGPERPYVPYIPRRRRSRANFSLEATGESYHGASEVDSRELGALRVGDNDEGSVLSTSSPWNESERLQREIDLVIGLDGGRVSPKDDNVEADKAARDGSYGSLASLSQWKQRYGESPRDNVPSLGAGDRRWVAGAPMAASGAGSSGIELVASTRSPLWRGHSEKRAEPSRPDWVASHVQEAPQGVELNVPSSQLLAHGGPESSSNVLGIVKTKDSFMPSGTTEQSSTMDKYLRKDEIPRIHKVLVPDAYEASRRTSDGRRVPGRALEASRPRAEQPPPTQPMRTYFWDSVRNKVKPVSSWLTEASASMSRRLEEEVTPSKPDGAPVSTGMHWQRKRPHERARPEYEEEIRRQMTAERDELDLQAALQKAHIEMLEQQIKQLREEANAPKEVQRPAEAVPSALKAVPSTKEVSAPETLANLARTVQPTIRRAHERAEPGKGRKGPDSPLSDDSGDESSSSEDDSGSKRADKRRERDKKARKAAIKAIHLNRPRGYDGEAVYDKYESWMDTFMDWRNGDAKDWYILNVRGHEKEWRLEDVSVEMYQGLFPDEQASFLREAFEKSRQGEKSLKKWHRSLGKLSKRVKFVTEHEFRRRFWYGSAIYLQSEWAKIGLHPEKESTTIAAMLEAGLRFERARKYEETAAKRIELNAVRPKRVAFVSEPDDSSEGESKTPRVKTSSRRLKSNALSATRWVILRGTGLSVARGPRRASTTTGARLRIAAQCYCQAVLRESSSL